MHPLILAIDQGTTSSRALLFDAKGEVRGRAQQEFPQLFPRDGWVEHDPEAIWSSVVAVCKEALASVPTGACVASIGITNQRETTVIWRRSDGKPIANAIVWQDRRTADACRKLHGEGHGELIQERTGLLLDPYFSATKIAWLLDHTPGAREQAQRGELCFGTVDSFLLWRLSRGKVHATDASNASRTMLFDIHRQRWDDDLLKLFNVPRSLLPEVRDNSALFSETSLFEVPITGMAGDQQAAAIGQACVQPGLMKSTYGTGCFVLVNTGNQAIASRHRLLTTVAYRLNGKTSYALEGGIFNAGTTMQWLRDKMKLIAKAGDSEAMAKSIPHTNGVYLVPAFTGLGAPYWDPAARGALVGLTRDSGISEIVRAGLESVAYQTNDLIRAMADDGITTKTLRVDGGMTGNAWLMQFLADILGVAVERPAITETTVFGAAYLAGMQLGFFPGLDELPRFWKSDRTFQPAMAESQRWKAYEGWKQAVARVKSDQVA